ncbi:uncharacterized protein A1O5_13367 [Cladophialophora psammophila CBS 110553]|uniref:FAD-binding domain-containing protein n=1 Tax=Cladophialophora psammophila CBS 110553 TaxID=1182543 RepID=W9VD55_9EURO|nr:uncharacterized protein A1O5_13367 [Cladophialophora psammophila CBS 110553]EXJ53378.1 hypothetical protein A1O5_13367 [Cladophialophora psammophila CBS 110553]
MTDRAPWVIVIGAGPAGLLLGLMLGQKGVPVHIVEKGDRIDDRPRATHYSAPALRELHRAGVLEEARRRGFIIESISWRKLDLTYLGGFSQKVFPKDDKELMVCLPLDRLGQLLVEHLNYLSNVDIKYRHEVVDIGQDDCSAWVEVQTPTGKQKLRAKYVVGCDGASSKLRRCLFGDNFPGFTWEEQIVATNTYFDFDKYGLDDANFILHPQHWYMAARISKYGLWRITYGEEKGFSNEELIARQTMKFEKFLPGNPKPEEGKYKVESISPYRVHQRLAEHMRVGRVLLAADAAHLCNPFGGMGLTGGIADIGSLYDCLIGIYEQRADESILDRYDEVRRAMYNNVINPISSANMRRLFSLDPDTATDNDEFLMACKRAQADENFSREFQRGVNAIVHDFTQYYKSG